MSYLTALERLHIVCVCVVCVSVSGGAVSVLVAVLKGQRDLVPAMSKCA